MNHTPLQQGVEKWNSSRVGERNAPCLKTSDFTGMDLRGYNFRSMDLSGARFRGSNLSGATFYACNLTGADFTDAVAKGTVFTDAQLNRALFLRANLIGANFSGAYLSKTIVDDADLCVATLSGAKFEETSFKRIKINDTAFANVDLLQGIFEDVDFQGPCDVGTGTLEMTAEGASEDPALQANVERFLRGCGTSEAAIDFFRERLGKPIQWYSAFISYAHKDKAFAKRLYYHLQGHGIRCWLDEKDLKAGERILEAINQAIRLHDKIVLCCSHSSLTSWWVQDEVRKAQEKERRSAKLVIVPVLLDKYLLSDFDDGTASDLRSRLAVDFSDWETSSAAFDTAVAQVVKALAKAA